ncbi:MAG TPA: glycoside hydrolase family 172 protein [Capsulimonadaceae bacterium]|nr:glycoside hydrolase family 172 protein [Capsulimonadaceae bacterium]
MTSFNGLGMGLHNIARLSNAQTRSISAENKNGEKGKGAMAVPTAGEGPAGDLGQGWKVSPCITVPAKSTVTLAEIAGSGAIQHMWITVSSDWWRRLVLRIYWDGEATPSVETPLGDFFCSGWCVPVNVNSLPIAVNPRGGFNSYWEMPFRKSAKVTIENTWDSDVGGFFYQVNYTLTDVPDDLAYFHAQWRRNNPLPYKTDHTLLDGVKGKGHYVGTYIAWGVNNNGWWGEGEIKFFLDGDTQFPTICGTGTEDYFGGAWCFDMGKGYESFSTPFLGLPQITQTDQSYTCNKRFGLYRWHIMDPIRFEKDLRVTIQALGWRQGGRFLALQDDIASTSFWYQTEPHAPFPQLPDRDGLEVI